MRIKNSLADDFGFRLTGDYFSEKTSAVTFMAGGTSDLVDFHQQRIGITVKID
jgi:hypothetical protein